MVSWSLWGSLVGGGVSAVPGNGVPDGVGPGAGAVRQYATERSDSGDVLLAVAASARC